VCRKEVGSFQESLKDEACVVACTQEAPLFSEIAQTANSPTQLKFINIREHAGWSKEGQRRRPRSQRCSRSRSCPNRIGAGRELPV